MAYGSTGLWSMVYGLWSRVYGLGSMVYGLWSRVEGLGREGVPGRGVRWRGAMFLKEFELRGAGSSIPEIRISVR
eukprot:2679523-Rhodomonas_salina.1